MQAVINCDGKVTSLRWIDVHAVDFSKSISRSDEQILHAYSLKEGTGEVQVFILQRVASTTLLDQRLKGGFTINSAGFHKGTILCLHVKDLQESFAVVYQDI